MVTTRAAARRSNSPRSTTSSRQASPIKANGSPSDGEGRIRPTRKKLAKTSIAPAEPLAPVEEVPGRPSLDSTSEAGSVADEDITAKTNGTRGRLRRKRSFEDVADELNGEKIPGSAVKPKRKRSRDIPKDSAEADDASVSSSSDESQAQEEATSTADTSVAIEKDVDTDNLAVTAPNGKLASPNVDEVEKASIAEAPVLESQAETSDKAVISPKIAEVDGKSAPTGSHVNGEKATRLSESTKEQGTKIPATSGFANFSAQSPFAALGQSKKPAASHPEPDIKPQTSASAFAASGFASLSSQTESPFGALAAKSSQAAKPSSQGLATFGAAAQAPSGFGALGAAAAAAPSPFAAAGAGPSVFGSGAHGGFGKFANGLGAGGGFGGGFGSSSTKPLSTFGSYDAAVAASVPKSVKPIGATDDDEEEREEGEGSGGENGEAEVGSAGEEQKAEVGFTDEEQKDDRFHEQDLTTGEEDETTAFKGRGKLYMMGPDKAWKERGVGDFKVNSKVESSADEVEAAGKITARFLMRVDKSHRVVLNSPITKDIKVEDPSRGPPKGKTAIFLGFVDGQLVTLQLKMRDNIQTTALYEAVCNVQAEM